MNILKKVSLRPSAVTAIILVAFAYAGGQVYLNSLMKEVGSVQQGKLLHFNVTWNEYVKGLKDYMKVHPGSEGYVTKWLNVPDWVDDAPEITAYIENGTGYLYAPVPAGMYTYAQSKTDEPQALGVSDSSSIRATTVNYRKPAVLPADKMVFVVNAHD